MKKKFLTVMACGVFALASGLALTACGGPKTETIDKAALNAYTETATMHFDKGYKYTMRSDSLDVDMQAAKNGENLDVVADSTNKGVGYTQNNKIYINGGQAFQDIGLGLEKIELNPDMLAYFTAPLESFTTFMDQFSAPETTEVTKTTDNENVTFTFVDKFTPDAEPGTEVSYDVNLEIVFVNDIIIKFEAESVNSDFNFKVIYEEFAGPVDFSGVDLTAYNKTFTYENLSVTLTNKFEDQTSIQDKFKKVYVSQTPFVMFMIDKDTTNYGQYNDEASYAQALISSGGMSAQVKKDDDSGMTYFAYTNLSQGYIYTYFAVVKKDTDAFWLCQFAVLQRDYSSLQNQIMNWAKTITIEQKN